jgi:hypothetical protein
MTFRDQLVDPKHFDHILTMPEQKIVFPKLYPPRTQTSVDTEFPLQPKDCKGCDVNQVYHTLPRVQLSPGVKDSIYGYPRSKEVSGPRSIAKQLYWQKTKDERYPWIYQYKPIDSLYGQDFSEFNDVGRRYSYQYKPYPFIDRFDREIVDYSKTFLPFPDIKRWTSSEPQKEYNENGIYWSRKDCADRSFNRNSCRLGVEEPEQIIDQYRWKLP